jgi:hypothetical protein
MIGVWSTTGLGDTLCQKLKASGSKYIGNGTSPTAAGYWPSCQADFADGTTEAVFVDPSVFSLAAQPASGALMDTWGTVAKVHVSTP